MGYIESIREMIGNSPIILVRPSILIINPQGEILLVKHQDDTWGVPGGLMELGETVEECAIREVEEEIGIRIRKLHLYGVFSGKELHAKLRNGHEYYNVVIGYFCTEYEGELAPDGVEVLDARFFQLNELPDKTNPFIQKKLRENARQIEELLAAR